MVRQLVRIADEVKAKQIEGRRKPPQREVYSMTQKQRVAEYIRDFGSISSLEAFRDLGVTRLSAVIFDLKADGYEFETKTEKVRNRYGEPCHYARYSLKK